MANIFQDILSKMPSKEAFLKSSEKAVSWLNSSITRKTALNTNKMILQMNERYRSTILPGRMYLFTYDPKTKDDLPYYDRFPLIFPFKIVKGGFYAINLHYLPYKHRAILMDALYPFLSDDNNNDMSRLRITYSILSKFSKSNLIKPCVKHYLNKQVKSKLVLVLPNEWNTALFLPLQQFRKANVKQVYADSLKKARSG